MVNIQYIAKKSNVSLRTVTNVLNNRDSQYSEKTKKRVLKIIEKYDYLPSRIARGLRTGSTKTIGFVVPDIDYHPIFSKMFLYIEDLLRKNNYNLFLYNSKENLIREQNIVADLLENKVDGILFIRIEEKDIKLKYLLKTVPLVACLRAFDDMKVTSVLTDNKMIGTIATEHLIKKGHRKIVHIMGNQDLLAHRDRQTGYRQALKNYDLKTENKYLFYIDYKDKDILEKLKNYFKKQKSFTAIFAYDDIVAANCIKALNNIGLSVPDDISIIGVNNSNFTTWLNPSLTVVKQPVKKICEHSVELLIDMIKNKSHWEEKKEKAIKFAPMLIERDSVKDII